RVGTPGLKLRCGTALVGEPVKGGRWGAGATFPRRSVGTIFNGQGMREANRRARSALRSAGISESEKMPRQPDDHHPAEHCQPDAEPHETPLAPLRRAVGMLGQRHAAVVAFGLLGWVFLLAVQAVGHRGILVIDRSLPCAAPDHG